MKQGFEKNERNSSRVVEDWKNTDELLEEIKARKATRIYQTQDKRDQKSNQIMFTSLMLIEIMIFLLFLLAILTGKANSSTFIQTPIICVVMLIAIISFFKYKENSKFRFFCIIPFCIYFLITSVVNLTYSAIAYQIPVICCTFLFSDRKLMKLVGSTTILGSLIYIIRFGSEGTNAFVVCLMILMLAIVGLLVNRTLVLYNESTLGASQDDAEIQLKCISKF